MLLIRLPLAGLVLLGCTTLTACGQDAPSGADSKEPAGDSGGRPGELPTVLPFEDPCRWLPTDAAVDALTDGGAQVPDGVATTVDPLGSSEDRSECWYSAGKDVGYVEVSLINSAEGAANWRETLDELAQAPSGSIDDAEMGFRQTLSKVGDLPTVLRSSAGADASDCEVITPTAEDSFLFVSVRVIGATDGEALCGPSHAVMTAVVDSLTG